MPQPPPADATLHERRAARLGRAERRRLRRVERRLNRAGLPMLARACLVLLFPFSGVDKIVHREAALKQADSSFLPPEFGRPMLVAGALVEIIAPVCIMLGWGDRFASLLLAGFCVITALMFHQFWRFPGYWSQSGSKGNSHFWEFLKNFGLVGGLLLLAITDRFRPASALAEHPFDPAPTGAASLA